MKYLVLVAEGMADLPLDSLRGRTPLEVARTPAMDEVVRRGQTGLAQTIPRGLNAGSDVGNLSFLGYDPAQYFTGRGPLEAAGSGIQLEPKEAVFRCNFVTVSGGRLSDYGAGHISTTEANVLVDALGAALSNERVRFYSGVGYRHLVAIRGLTPASLRRTSCDLPHNMAGEPIRQHLPRGPGSRQLRSLIKASQEVLAGHDINHVRVDLGENPANLIWPWGGGMIQNLSAFKTRFGVSGSVVSAVDVVRGIGSLAGLRKIHVPGATGYYNTDYPGKGRAAIDALTRDDFVYCHVQAPDEASHHGDLRQKISAIEHFDRWVVRPALDYMNQNPDTRILVGSGHMVSMVTRTNRDHPIPFAFCGKGIDPGGTETFGEQAASGSLRFTKAHELMPYFIRGEK